MSSKNCLEGFCLFFLFVVVVSTSQTKWPCVFSFEDGHRYDLTLQNGNTSNSNQPYVTTTEDGVFTLSFYLCDPVKNPFSVKNSKCDEETQICLTYDQTHDTNAEDETNPFDDLVVGEGPPFIYEDDDDDLTMHTSSSSKTCSFYLPKSTIHILCPYNERLRRVFQRNNDFSVYVGTDYKASYCPRSISIYLYLDSACIGPFCCTYQNEENSFDTYSLCAENTCPPLSGYSLIHSAHLNGRDCLACKSYFDENAKCCVYSNQRVAYEFSGTCPPKSGSHPLISEFPTTSLEHCQILDATRSGSSSSSSDSSSDSSSSPAALYFLLGLLVAIFVVGGVVLSYLFYFKENPWRLEGRQVEMMPEMETTSEE